MAALEPGRRAEADIPGYHSAKYRLPKVHESLSEYSKSDEYCENTLDIDKFQSRKLAEWHQWEVLIPLATNHKLLQSFKSLTEPALHYAFDVDID
jgi:hypothetical protein